MSNRHSSQGVEAIFFVDRLPTSGTESKSRSLRSLSGLFTSSSRSGRGALRIRFTCRQSLKLIISTFAQRNPAYDPAKVSAEVWSLSDPNGLSPKVQPGSVDVATLIVRGIFPADCLT